MSERSHTVPVPEGEYFESSRFAGLSLLLGSVALVALVLCAVGAVVNPHQFSYSWLFAFAFFSTGNSFSCAQLCSSASLPLPHSLCAGSPPGRTRTAIRVSPSGCARCHLSVCRCLRFV